MASLDWKLEYDGQVVPLFKYQQLEGLSCEALKSRAARLREVLAPDYELPLKTSNSCDELIRYILCMQSSITSDIQGSSDPLSVTRDCFSAPEHFIESERLRPTTPPRLRREVSKRGSDSIFSRQDRQSARLSTSPANADGRGPVTAVVSNTDLKTTTSSICPASLLEVNVNGKLLPLYHYDQVQYLKHETLAARVRMMEDVVGSVWQLPKATSRRHEDLIIYLLCVQAQLVAHHSNDPLAAGDILVKGFGAPSEWGATMERKHDMRSSFHSQRMHYKSKYEDHLTADSPGLQPKAEFGQDTKRPVADPYAVVKTDHLRGDVSVGAGFADTAMGGYLPKCIGRGKRHIEPEANEPEERGCGQWPDIVPEDHLKEGGYVADFDGKRDDEVDRGHGRRYMDSFVGENNGGRILLQGNV